MFRRQLSQSVSLYALAGLAMRMALVPAQRLRRLAQAPSSPTAAGCSPAEASARSPRSAAQRRSALPAEITCTRLTGAHRVRREKTLQHLAELEEELGGLRVKVEEILSSIDRDRRVAAPTARRRQVADREARSRAGQRRCRRGAGHGRRARAADGAGAASTAPSRSTELTWVRARQLIEQHHGPAALAVHQEPHGAPAEPAVAGRVARDARECPARRTPDRLPGRTTGGLGATTKQHRLCLLLGRRSSCSSRSKFVVARRTNRRTRARRAAPAHLLRARHLGASGSRRCARCRSSPPACSLYVRPGRPRPAAGNPWGAAGARDPQGRRSCSRRSRRWSVAVLAPGAPQWRLVALAETPGAARRLAARRHRRRLRPRWRSDRGLSRVLRAAGAQRGAVVRVERRLRRPPDRPAADAVHASRVPPHRACHDRPCRLPAALAARARAGSSCRSG